MKAIIHDLDARYHAFLEGKKMCIRDRRNNNGTIPGYRPGKPTSDFITKVLGKITFVGALFLAVVAVLPIALSLSLIHIWIYKGEILKGVKAKNHTDEQPTPRAPRAPRGRREGGNR